MTGLTRWMEYSLNIKQYLELTPAKSEAFQVVAREITVPVCQDCVVTIRLSAEASYVKDATDWSVPLDPLVMVSLESCYLKFNIKGKSTSRALKLKKLDMYTGGKSYPFNIYMENKPSTHSKIIEEWDQSNREVTFSSIFLKYLAARYGKSC